MANNERAARDATEAAEPQRLTVAFLAGELAAMINTREGLLHSYWQAEGAVRAINQLVGIAQEREAFEAAQKDEEADPELAMPTFPGHDDPSQEAHCEKADCKEEDGLEAETD